MIRINLIGLPRQKRRGRAPAVTLEGGRSLILLAVVVLGVSGVTYVRHGRFQQQVQRLNEQVAALNLELAELTVIRAEYDTFSRRKDLLTRRINIIEGLKAKQAGPVQLLSTLASAVVGTDSLWLTGFAQTGQTVTIEGTALNVKAVADFLTRLINARIFAEVDLRETAQDTADKEMDKFFFTVNGQLVAPAPTT